ncbi:ribonuclease H-like domain-containing protein [Tanacetum coccineum]
MGKSSRNKKRAMENLNLFYPDIGTSLSTGRHLTQEEATKEALALRISQKFALLEEVRPVLETMAYHDKYKKVLDEIWKDKVELDVLLEGKVNENALVDTGSDINTMPYRIYEKLGREEIKKVDREITMIKHTQAEAMGILTNVLCQVGVTTIIAKFLILDIPIDRDAPIVVGRGFLYTIGGIVNTPERLFSTFDGICHQTFCAARLDVLRTVKSDSNDEEEYDIKRNKFGAPIYGLKPAAYLNYNNPAERSLALQAVINPVRKISVWKKAVSFLGSLHVPLQHVNWKPNYKGCYTNEEEAKGQWRTEIRIMGGNDDEAGSSRSKPSRQYETVEEVLLLQVHHEFLLWEGCNNEAKSRYNTKLANLLPRHVYSPCVVNWDVLNRIGCDGEIDDMLRIKLREAESNEEIFTSVAWIRAFNIKEPIYSELCREFYSTYEFDEVYADDELQTKKIINFRLGGRAHSLTLLEFARKLGLYHAERHQNGYVNVAWLIARWIKRKGAGTQKESQICYGQFITKLARKLRVLSDEVLRSLSALIYCRDLDTTTLRELIDFEGRLIPKDPQPGVPRVGILRPLRASMQDLYEMMGNMEIRQGVIERMSYRQSYH